MPPLESANRRIPKATYVPIKVDNTDIKAGEFGRALIKNAYIRNLRLQVGEVNDVRRFIADRPEAKEPRPEVDGKLFQALLQFEGQPLLSELPTPSVFADFQASSLLTFGLALAEIRKAKIRRIGEEESNKAANHSQDASPLPMRPHAYDAGFNSIAYDLYNSAKIHNKAFKDAVSATPIGMLNLERIEMTPAGIERGELVGTIPLAPREKTAVVQKEWSVTTRELTEIVTDSLENYSETGVTENTELTQSTSSQIQHSNQFNINASVSGSYGLVTASVASSFGSQDSNSLSAQDSRRHAIAVTKKASTRVKQEHKVTISTTTVTGTSQESTRVLENPSNTDPIRIDYFSLMRKWRVRLYRYGLRLTYDIAIPEPGAALRANYAELAKCEAEIAAPFTFDLTPDKISRQNISQLQQQYGIVITLPPEESKTITTGEQVPNVRGGWTFFDKTFNVDNDYQVSQLTVNAMIGIEPGNATYHFKVMGAGWPIDTQSAHHGETFELPHYIGSTGPQTISFFFNRSDMAWIGLTIKLQLTPQAEERWKSTVWKTCYDAALAKFNAHRDAVADRIQLLRNQIANVDTLTLRREESNEIMKCALQWLLGTSWDFMPDEVQQLFKDPQNGLNFAGNNLGISSTDWSIMYQYQEMVKFINEAIEWENILYFLYPYFWDVPASWNFVRQLRHTDSTRQAFLRAGSARVVLPVRKGYEEAWLQFVEMGDFKKVLPSNHPYMTIAQEIQAYDNKNYPGIPPANPGASPVEPGNAVTTTCSSTTSPSTSPVTISVTSSIGFQKGARAIIDTHDSNVQETQVIVDVPDATHIKVEKLDHAHDGTAKPFPIILASESGLLIAEWHEYTPSSGVDIAVTSNLTSIA